MLFTIWTQPCFCFSWRANIDLEEFIQSRRHRDSVSSRKAPSHSLVLGGFETLSTRGRWVTKPFFSAKYIWINSFTICLAVKNKLKLNIVSSLSFFLNRSNKKIDTLWSEQSIISVFKRKIIFKLILFESFEIGERPPISGVFFSCCYCFLCCSDFIQLHENVLSWHLSIIPRITSRAEKWGCLGTIYFWQYQEPDWNSSLSHHIQYQECFHKTPCQYIAEMEW